MHQVNASERATQNHVIRFFSDKEKLNYTYLGDLHDRENSNIMEGRLRAWLAGRGIAERLITGAIDQLQRAANDLSQGLYYANQQVYALWKHTGEIHRMSYRI